MDRLRTLYTTDVGCRPRTADGAGGCGPVVDLAYGNGGRNRGEVSARSWLTARNEDTEERHEFSNLSGRLRYCLWNCRSPSSASSHQRVGRRGGTVVSPDGGLVVWRDLPSCFVCVGFSIGIADTGLNRSPSGQGQTGTTVESPRNEEHRNDPPPHGTADDTEKHLSQPSWPAKGQRCREAR